MKADVWGEDEDDGCEMIGLLRVNVSPAPSQSELVRMGVCMWTNSFSYRISVKRVKHTAALLDLTSNQSCQYRIRLSLTRMIAAVRAVLKRRCAWSRRNAGGRCFFWIGYI